MDDALNAGQVSKVHTRGHQRQSRGARPARLRLARGTRLCEPDSGSFPAYGGRWVGVERECQGGFIVWFKGSFYFVTYAQVGKLPPLTPTQLRLNF